MKIRYLFSYPFLACLLLTGCDPLDTKIDTLITQKNLDSDYNKLRDLGYEAYSYVRSGFYAIDSNIPAAMTDEAEYTAPSSSVQRFNDGSWNQFNNPDDQYVHNYQGLRAANYFLDYSTDYKNQLAHNRDTLSDRGYQYRLDVEDIAWLRAETRVLRAWFYFDLIKRYGDVPLIKEVIDPAAYAQNPREKYDVIVDYAVAEIDAVINDLQENWKTRDVDRDGRFTQGSAMALKSRILLYAASPLHNENNDVEKWKRAAKAAYDVIQLNRYTLSSDYRTLFLEDNSTKDDEIIMSIRSGSTNDKERANYPIGTPGGASGVTPSHNLVSAYEYKGTPNPDDPYANRDPRLDYSIVTNNSWWNGRTMEIYTGGTDDPANTNSSRTGYYLKKFLMDNLYLIQDEKRIHNWVVFRYAEILLNYAEAMNEAYGPDADNGYGLTARQALNMVRARQGVEMPPVTETDLVAFRNKVKHERRIELAFEDHRFWDLLRWKDAGTVLNEPIKGVRITPTGDNKFTYEETTVERRIFVAPRMYLYPIPNTEINKAKDVLTQNPEW